MMMGFLEINIKRMVRVRVRPMVVAVAVVSLLSLMLTACNVAIPGLPGSNGAESGLSSTEIYQERQVHHPDGIGKFYLGREIAQVMGHQGVGWLERSSRTVEEQPEKAIAALNLRPTDVVADIGAGTGYFSFRISSLVPQGKVYAVDIQPEMLEILTFLKQEQGITNVEPTQGSTIDPQLPPCSIDLALMVDAYHEFDHPREMMQGIVRALKPEGRVVLLEYRGENPFIAIKGLHKMTQRQVKKEMRSVGLVWQETQHLLPQQHLMIFGLPKARLTEVSELPASPVVPGSLQHPPVAVRDLPVSADLFPARDLVLRREPDNETP